MNLYQKRTLSETTLNTLKIAHAELEPTNPARKAQLFGLIQRKSAALDSLNDEIAIQERKRETELAELNAVTEALKVYNARYDNDLFANVQLAVARAFDVSIKVVRDQPDSDAFQTVTLVLDSAEFYCGVQSRAYAPAELLKIMVARPEMSPAVSKFLARFLFPSNR